VSALALKLQEGYERFKEVSEEREKERESLTGKPDSNVDSLP